MPQLRSSRDVNVDAFMKDGLAVKRHLSLFLDLSLEELERRLPCSTEDLADLHPGAFHPEEATTFYEDTVGTGHLIELAAWHLSSSDYIADTLRLQGMAVSGQVLDFGGGIGTHALSAAALPQGAAHVGHAPDEGTAPREGATGEHGAMGEAVERDAARTAAVNIAEHVRAAAEGARDTAQTAAANIAERI